MATAAPAAPAAPSTSAQPTAQPAPGAETTPAAQPVARTAKPIPSARPQLPGVFPDDDPFPAAPSRADSPTPPGDAPGRPSRGPDGRFLPGTSPAQDAAEHTLEPANADAPAPEPVSKFKFAGEEYDSQAAAEQQVRTLRGQFKPVQALARNLGGMEHIVPKFTEAATSARGWKAEADRLSAELAAVRSGAPTAQSPPSPSTSATDAATEGIDWELYAEVTRLATESGEPWKAQQWLHEQSEKLVSSRVQSLLDERLAPLAQREHQAEVVAKTETLFGSLAGYTNSDGSPAFPELNDETSAYEVGKLWATLGLPADFAMTPQGAIAAIGIYRMAKSGSQARANTSPAPTAPSAPMSPTDAHAAAALSDGRPTVASVAGGGTPSAEAARILNALRSANASGSRAHLGFDA